MSAESVKIRLHGGQGEKARGEKICEDQEPTKVRGTCSAKQVSELIGDDSKEGGEG